MLREDAFSFSHGGGPMLVRRATFVWLIAAATVGCAHSKRDFRCCFPRCGLPAPPPAVAAALPPGDVADYGEADFSVLASGVPEAPPPLVDLTAQTGKVVAIDEARRLAKANSPAVRRAIYQAQFARSIAPCVDGQERSATLLEADMADLTVTKEQNEAAAAAAQATLDLLDAKVQRANLERIIAALNESRSQLVQAEEQGLISPDLSEVDSQISQAKAGLRTAEQGAQQAASRLALLMGLDPSHPGPLEPHVDLSDPGPPIAIDDAVREAVSRRPELLQLELMLSRLNTQNLQMAAKAGIQTPGPSRPPAPSMPEGPLPCQIEDAKQKHQCEMAHYQSLRNLQLGYTREQLFMRIDEVRRDTERAVAAAVNALNSQARAVRLANEELQQRRDRLARLEDRAKVVETAPIDLFKARIAVLQAEQDFVSSLIARKKAWANFHSAITTAAEEGPLPGLHSGAIAGE